MLKTDRKMKIMLCVMLSAVIALSSTMTGDVFAEEAGNDLYFGAMEEKIEQKLETTKVEQEEFFVTGAATGTVRYNNVSYVINEITEGKVRFQEFLVGTGNTVKKGDPVARISIELDNSEVELLKLNREIIEDDIDNYISDTGKLLEVYKDKAENGAGEEERKLGRLAYEKLNDEYQKKISEMEDRITETSTRIDMLEDIIGTEYIYAGMDGVIGNTNWLMRGSTIEPYTYICSIYDKSDITVVVEGGNDLLRYNMPVKLYQTNGGNQIELTGKVRTLKSTAISTNLTARDDIIEVYGDPTELQVNKDIVIRFDKVYVPDALTVLKTAVHTDNKGSYVNLLINGYSSKRYVVVGGTGAQKCWIASGVSEGDTVILN